MFYFLLVLFLSMFLQTVSFIKANITSVKDLGFLDALYQNTHCVLLWFMVKFLAFLFQMSRPLGW